MTDQAVDPERRPMDEVVTGLPTKSAKIRALDGEGYSRSQIAKFLKIRYQHAYNVLKNAKPAAENKEPEPLPQMVWLKMGPGGRIVIPAAFREAMRAKDGDDVQVRLDGDEVRVIGRAAAIRRAQALVAPYVKEGESWVDELIAERRREARREEADGDDRP